ncbi:CHASE4 domain-containing protein [Clostridium aciditolerans]|uniref:Circadian input-output histidine kinase CikA n=1 Tax=Clostridium aciditolerans TaxID=339861 RepID=A0A934M609_9CLOT|nr:CHASE4 domain-containing protein [Clostridium aciditolerans]MBI6872581.1 response regulator [Clostridium aciditolerans]
MSLRKKTIYIISFTFLCLILLLYVISTNIIGRGFSHLENEYIQNNVYEAMSVLKDDVVALNISVSDWSNWDDTYEFIEDKNYQYIRSNLGDSIFTQLDINSIIFINYSGNIVFSKGYDLENKKPFDIPDDFKKIVLSDNFFNRLNSDHNVNGIIMTSQGPSLVAAKPILHSDGSGTSRGFVVMSKYLNYDEIKRISHTTGLSLDIKKIYNNSLPKDFSYAYSNLKKGQEVFIKALDENKISGYSIIKDINNSPILLLKVTTPRPIYNQAVSSIKFFTFSLFVVAMILCLIIFIFLEKSVLSPLKSFSDIAKKISKSKDLSIRFPSSRQDELGYLMNISNAMLEALELFQRKLQKSEHKYRHLFESLVDGFVYCKVVYNEKNPVDYIFMEVNSAFEEIIGIEKGNIIGKKAKDIKFKFENSIVSWEELLSRTVINGEKIKFELNSPINNKCYLVSAYCPEENYCIALFKDITELKEVENQLILARDSAESANAAKSIFLANMSHEIRTPMNAVIGMTELLTKSQLNDKQKEIVSSIEGAGRLLLNIINDILDYSKIDAGKMTLNHFEFNLDSVIKSVADIMAVKAYEKKLSLITHVSPEIPTIIGDGDKLCQILLNLVGNAIKFTNSGEVIIKAFLNKITESYAVVDFEVCDTGIGIEPDKIEKLFKPFIQADGSTTRKFGGTGLGLSISKGIIDLMKGNIMLESTLGKGTTFKFNITFEYLNIAKEKHPSEELKDANILKSLKLKQISKLAVIDNNYEKKALGKILLVEDNPINQKLAFMQLKKLEINVDIASNGKEALDKISTQRYSLMFMDCQMPELDGFDTTKAIRKLEPTLGYHPIIVAMTANAMEGDREKCLSSGMDDYISKPVKIQNLCDIFNKWKIKYSKL